MTRLTIAILAMSLAAIFVWGLDAILKRVVLWVMVMLIALAGSGCAYYIVPAKPHTRYCFPANSWKCSPMAEWADM